jgi:hypothetical protein
MLDSLQLYGKGLLDGLGMPAGVPGPLTAWITPPVVEKMSAPRAYVWGGRLKGRRQTAPRGPGFMRLDWTLDVYVAYMSTPAVAMAEEPFPKITDAVLKVFMTTVMPLFIDAAGRPMGPNQVNETDTQIQAIGESFDGDYPPERSVAGPRMLWYVQRFGIDVVEVVQA